MKKTRIFYIWCMIMILLAGCGNQGGTLHLSGIKTDPDRFVWGSNSDITASLGDSAFFYMKDCLLCFYDLEEKEEYILCGKANCLHNSSECSAYFPRNIIGESADNVAQIDEYIYCTYLSATIDASQSRDFANELQLLCIDPSTGTRKVIAAFPHLPEVTEDTQTFYAVSIGTVQYCNGYAWFDLKLQQPAILENQKLAFASFTQLCGVNLETEELICLNQYDGYTYEFDVICADSVVYTRYRDTIPMLSEDEFYKNAAEDGTVTIDGILYETYTDYEIWHWRNTPDEYGIYAYDPETAETQVLMEGISEVFGNSYQIPYEIYGVYEGNYLCRVYDYNEVGTNFSYHKEICLLDPVNGEMEALVEWRETEGGCLAIAQGYDANLVFADGTFFYTDDRNEETSKIYVYDLNTKTSTYLFTDDVHITFRIFGEYQNGYFGKHKDHQYQEGYYWISEEDFFTGNLDAMIHYDVG